MSEIVKYNPENQQNSWITITVAGATIGTIVASLTYASTSMASNVVATSSGFTVETLGEACGYGADYFFGKASGMTVRLLSKTFAKSTELTVKQSGQVTAGVISVLAGAVTALSITAGTRLVEYSIEYGGKISKELAIQISEAYLKYKASQEEFQKTGAIDELLGEEIENDWILIKGEKDDIELQPVNL
jgi:hypothetical protein